MDRSLRFGSISQASEKKMASSTSYTPPCAACKFFRRKCLPACIFAPHFPQEEPHKFACVHRIFGASNVAKLLADLLPHQRAAAVCSLAYEAEARVQDPVHGCVGAITHLQRQIHRLQRELDAANDLILLAYGSSLPLGPPLPSAVGGGEERFYGVVHGGGGGVEVAYQGTLSDIYYYN